MNSKQESRYSMELALRDFLNQNKAVISSLPGFGSLFTAFSDNIDQIQVIREKQEADKTGIALTKEQLRNDLVAKTTDISRKTAAYAKMTNNVVLMKEVHYSVSDLKMAADVILKDRALLVHDNAGEHLTELAEYGVTAEILSALKSVIDLFFTVMPKPRLGIIEKKQATDQLAQLFTSNHALVQKFDILVEIIRLTQPAFYAAYRDNRKVIETGKGSLALKAVITDSETKAGIRGVTVSFAQQNGSLSAAIAKGEKRMVKITSHKGMFRIKHLPAGTYKATFNKPGYQEKVVPVTVADNERTELTVELERD